MPFKPQARLDIRKYSFSHRVVDNWNALPQSLIDCKTLDNFKVKLGKTFQSVPPMHFSHSPMGLCHC
mgnify:CR=1 FL=1